MFEAENSASERKTSKLSKKNNDEMEYVQVENEIICYKLRHNNKRREYRLSYNKRARKTIQINGPKII